MLGEKWKPLSLYLLTTALEMLASLSKPVIVRVVADERLPDFQTQLPPLIRK